VTELKVLLLEPFDPRGMDLLKESAEVVFARSFDEDTLVEQARDVDGIVARARGTVSRRVMENAPRLKVVGRHGVGVDNIDVEAATELGIQVVNTPLANMESVAEHTIGILLGLSKLIVRVDRGLRRGQWREEAEFRGNELKGKTLGIVGTGRVGTRVAEIASLGFDMDLLYRDVVPNPRVEEIGARRCDLDELLALSDYVTLHVPLIPETEYLIGERELGLMKPTAYLLNLSRGNVVKEAALIDALQTGRIAGAGLDVYEVEPLPSASPFLDMENVVLTPHMSSHTDEALWSMSMVVKDVLAVLGEHPPDFPVNRV
jgi:D-3-phosphoglycerate dehydrogenase